jgi:AraC family transcriptional regulator
MHYQSAKTPGCEHNPAALPPSITIGGAHAALLPRAPYEARYTPCTAMIGFAFEAQAGMHAFASDREASFRTRPNSLAYVPAGCDVMSRSAAGGEYLTVRLVAGSIPASPTERRFSDHIDSAAIAAAQNLRRMLLTGQSADVLQFEAETAQLRDAAWRVAAGRATQAPAARWMTVRRLRLVDELIEAKLESSLTVGELAAALGPSSGFFRRAFKAAVGKAPHHYIIDRRLSRARELLRTGNHGLAEIAAACGFASHAHMTALFRRRLGVTPNSLRGR